MIGNKYQSIPYLGYMFYWLRKFMKQSGCRLHLCVMGGCPSSSNDHNNNTTATAMWLIGVGGGWAKSGYCEEGRNIIYFLGPCSRLNLHNIEREREREQTYTQPSLLWPNGRLMVYRGVCFVHDHSHLRMGLCVRVRGTSHPELFKASMPLHVKQQCCAVIRFIGVAAQAQCYRTR